MQKRIYVKRQYIDNKNFEYLQKVFAFIYDDSDANLGRPLYMCILAVYNMYVTYMYLYIYESP